MEFWEKKKKKSLLLVENTGLRLKVKVELSGGCSFGAKGTVCAKAGWQERAQ